MTKISENDILFENDKFNINNLIIAAKQLNSELINKNDLSNHLIKFEEIDHTSQKNNDDDIQENNSPNWNIDRVYEYDNSQLQDGEGEGFMKLDSSYENLNVNDMNVGGLFYINHK